jgi:hypothetical protein
MTGIEEIHQLIRAWEENYFTSLEFQDRVLGQLRELPAAEQHSMLESLSAHADEVVRNVALEFRQLQRHEALSKDIDYVRRNSPLRPGIRLELFGGYDYYASEGKPAWLNGRECYKATFLGFTSYGEDTIPVALVEFDELIEVFGQKGRYGILFGTYASDWVAWSQTDDVVAVCVKEALPEDVTLIRSFRASDAVVETHATCRIEGTA